MPIEKLNSGQLIFRFGSGDILISPATDKPDDLINPKYIILHQSTPHPIDVEIPELIGTKVFDWAVKMYFDKPESIDAFIHVLRDFKVKVFPDFVPVREGEEEGKE